MTINCLCISEFWQMAFGIFLLLCGLGATFIMVAGHRTRCSLTAIVFSSLEYVF